MIINQFGGILLADLPPDLDGELISFRFLALAKNCKTTLDDLRYGKLRCISFQTESTFFTAFGLGQSWLFMLGPIESKKNQLAIFEKSLGPSIEQVNKALTLSPEQLQKLSESDEFKLRKLTLEASEDLQSLLLEIGQVAGVVGCLIVGHDGLLIANSLPEEIDAESIGVWSLGVYMNTDHVMKKLGHERVHQIVSRTPRGFVVIADFGGGLLVAVAEGNVEKVIPIMRKITDLVS